MNEKSLKKAHELQKNHEHELCLSMCIELLNENPGDHEALRLKSSVLDDMGRLDEAVSALIGLANESEEPADYFDLALLQFKRREFTAGIEAINSILSISEKENFDYYVDSARFLRAFALIKIGKYSLAAADLEGLESDMRLWVPGHGLITLDDLRAAI